MLQQPSISVNDFISLSQRNEEIFVVDLRTAAEVNTEYFSGCLHLPLQEIDAAKLQSRLNSNGCKDDDTIYLLCGSGQRAQRAADLLAHDINNPLVVVEGGIHAMKQTGVKLEKGSSEVISLDRQVRIAAGLFILLGILLGGVVNPAFYGLCALVGAGLIFTGITNNCAMGLLLARMPWNK